MLRNKKTKFAGRLVSAAIYPVAAGFMPAAVRDGKKKATSAAMKRLNFKTSCEKLAGILAANFERGDDVFVLTYDPANLPKNRDRVVADLKAFRGRAAKEWKRNGKPFRMAWSIEHKHGDGRWHIHAVANRLTGNDGMLLYKLWGKGTDFHFKHLRTDKQKNHIGLARYMAKESADRENSRRAWSYTRNCLKPETVIDRNVGDETLQLPKGAILLEQEIHTNEYGTWEYIRYYVPEDAPEGPPQAA